MSNAFGCEPKTTCNKPVAVVAPMTRRDQTTDRKPSSTTVTSQNPRVLESLRLKDTTTVSFQNSATPTPSPEPQYLDFRLGPESAAVGRKSGISEELFNSTLGGFSSGNSGKVRVEELSAGLAELSTVNSSQNGCSGASSHAVDACNFYYASMTNSEAKSRLRGRAVGTFLLRDSSDARFRYSLSIQTPRGTTSIRIYRTNSGHFRLDSDPQQESRMPVFETILALIEHYFVGASGAPAGGRTRHNRCVLLESSGRSDTPMLLRTPLELNPAPLAHLCRRLINNLVPSERQRQKLVSRAREVTQQQAIEVQRYMRDYHYRV